MTDSSVSNWQKELRILLDHIDTHPSADLTEQHARVVVLNQLLKEREAQQPAR